MKPTWKEHQLTKAGVVEELPLEWVWQYFSYDVTSHTQDEDGTEVSLTGLWKAIEANGMRDPLIIRVGLENRKMRLEAGNHRIQLLRKHGIEKVPVAVQVRHLCGPNAPGPMTDATVVFDLPKGGIKISEITSEYMKPSDMFWTFDV